MFAGLTLGAEYVVGKYTHKQSFYNIPAANAQEKGQGTRDKGQGTMNFATITGFDWKDNNYD